MQNLIENKTFDEERALYNLCGYTLKNCKFEGETDGESALKEARDVILENCSFSLRYPIWHTVGFKMTDCKMNENVRAALWYSKNGVLENCLLHGIKAVRECKNIKINSSDILSEEFGWRCKDININASKAESVYFLFESENINIENLDMKGKYSFQYCRNVTVKNSFLDTKDAFWHSENVTVENCTVKGEYLGWYSNGLTLKNCKIIGTQPLCYCENLKLVNCTTEDCDLAFEYSDVFADISGSVLSVKNPKSGTVFADSIGEIITSDSIIDSDCNIFIKTKKE